MVDYDRVQDFLEAHDMEPERGKAETGKVMTVVRIDGVKLIVK